MREENTSRNVIRVYRIVICAGCVPCSEGKIQSWRIGIILRGTGHLKRFQRISGKLKGESMKYSKVGFFDRSLDLSG